MKIIDKKIENFNKRARTFSFTLNNPSSEDFIHLENLSKEENSIQEIVYQLQLGKEKSTPHIQGYVNFKFPRYFYFVVKIFPKCHLQIAINKWALKRYCEKENDYPDKRYHYILGSEIINTFTSNENEIKIHIYPKLEKKDQIIGDSQLYPWQRDIQKIVDKKPDKRTFYYIFDPDGDTGKSSLIEYFHYKYPRNVFSSNGKPPDVRYGFHIMNKKQGSGMIRVVFWDIPRAEYNLERDSISRDIFTVAESFKNGRFFNTKYESTTVSFPSPHVIIFSNRPPVLDLLSLDRWKIFTIKEKELIPMSLDEVRNL